MNNAITPDIKAIRTKYGLNPQVDLTICGNGSVAQISKAREITTPKAPEIAEYCRKLFPDSGDLTFDLDGRDFYLDLSRRLQAYYSGTREPIPSYWSKNYRDLVELHKRRYINLYDLLDYAWEKIESLIRRNGYRLIPSSPADAVKAIMEADVRLEIAKFQDNKPRKNYWKLGGQARDLDTAKCQNTPKYKPKFNALARKLFESLPDDYIEIKEVELICMHCIEQIVPKDQELIKQVNKFKKSEKNMTKFIRKVTHPDYVTKC